MAFTGNFSCNTLRAGLMNGTINFSSSTFYLALYTNSATLDQTTTAYTATGEASGGNYVAGGEVLEKKERKFEVTPLCCSYMGDEIVSDRRVLTRVTGGMVFPEGKEVVVRYNRKIRNKIVSDSIQDKRRYFDFAVGDEIMIRSSKENSRFVKILQ